MNTHARATQIKAYLLLTRAAVAEGDERQADRDWSHFVTMLVEDMKAKGRTPPTTEVTA